MSTNNKKGLSPNVIQDLRREFRIRSAKKQQLQQQQQTTTSRASKPSHRSTPVRRKTSKQQVSTSTTRESNNTTSKYQQPVEDTTVSKYQIPGSADRLPELDPPTEFENAGLKPAKFTKEWHKFSVPLDQLPSKEGAKKRKTKSAEKKKIPRKVSHRRKSSTSNTPSIAGVAPDDHSKPKPEMQATSSKKSGSRRKRGGGTAEVSRKIVRKKSSTAATASKEAKPVDAKPAKEKRKLSGETTEEIPLVSMEEDDPNVTQRAAREDPKINPSKEADVKLKPYTEKAALSPTPNSSSPPPTTASPTTSASPTPGTNAEEFSALDVGLDDGNDRAPPKIIETDKCGNANFPVVVAAGKIIDYCDEKDLFKEFIDPSDLPTFNSFCTGEVKSMADLLTILEHLMDQIVESKKLSETEAIAKDWILVSKDRIEGRNYLLDSFLSKKAKLNVSDQVLTAKKSTSSVTPNAPSTSPTTTSIPPISPSCSDPELEPNATPPPKTTPEAVQTPLDPEDKKEKNV